MSEGSSSVAITKSIDAGHIGTKLIVHLDVTAMIHFNPRLFQTEVIGIRHTSDREKHMRAGHNLIPATALNMHDYLVAPFFQSDALSAQPNFDAFVFENRFDGF